VKPLPEQFPVNPQSPPPATVPKDSVVAGGRSHKAAHKAAFSRPSPDHCKIELPWILKSQKARYIAAARRQERLLVNFVFNACDQACYERCDKCGGELSRCGAPDAVTGEPTMDCFACYLKYHLKIANARIRELELERTKI